MRLSTNVIFILGLITYAHAGYATMSTAMTTKDQRIGACLDAHNAAVKGCLSMSSADQATATSDMTTSATLSDTGGVEGAFRAQARALGQVSDTYAQKAGVCKAGFVACQKKCNPAADLSPNVNKAIADCGPDGPLDVQYQTLMSAAGGNAIQASNAAGVARNLASDGGNSNIVQASGLIPVWLHECCNEYPEDSTLYKSCLWTKGSGTCDPH